MNVAAIVAMAKTERVPPIRRQIPVPLWTYSAAFCRYGLAGEERECPEEEEYREDEQPRDN
jgi:hypothetical protein